MSSKIDSYVCIGCTCEQFLVCWCRHVAVSPQTVETTDKFRIHMFEEGTNEVSQLVADVVKQVNGEFASGLINQIGPGRNLNLEAVSSCYPLTKCSPEKYIILLY